MRRRRCEQYASSEGLPDAEKEVDVAQRTNRILQLGANARFRHGAAYADQRALREGRWIQVVTQIEPHWADGRLVAHSYPQRVRKIVEAAGRVRVERLA